MYSDIFSHLEQAIQKAVELADHEMALMIRELKNDLTKNRCPKCGQVIEEN